MTPPESTSAEAFNQYVSGKLIAASNGWKDLLVRIYSAYPVRESSIVPAVAEPFIVQVLSGAAVVEERERVDPFPIFHSLKNGEGSPSAQRDKPERNRDRA